MKKLSLVLAVLVLAAMAFAYLGGDGDTFRATGGDADGTLRAVGGGGDTRLASYREPSDGDLIIIWSAGDGDSFKKKISFEPCAGSFRPTKVSFAKDIIWQGRTSVAAGESSDESIGDPAL